MNNRNPGSESRRQELQPQVQTLVAVVDKHKFKVRPNPQRNDFIDFLCDHSGEVLFTAEVAVWRSRRSASSECR